MLTGAGVRAAQGAPVTIAGCRIGGWGEGVAGDALGSNTWLDGGTTVTGCTVHGLDEKVSCGGVGNRVCGNPGGNCVNPEQTSCGCAPGADPC